MGEWVISQAFEHGRGCDLCREESCHLRIDGSYGVNLFECFWHGYIWLYDEKYRRLVGRACGIR